MESRSDEGRAAMAVGRSQLTVSTEREEAMRVEAC